jgi:hypothetical protein
MQTVWYLRGELAGSHGVVSDADAKKLEAEGTAQIFDGVTPLGYPENHPDVIRGVVQMNPIPGPKTTTRKKKYPNKAMTTDETTGVGED